MTCFTCIPQTDSLLATITASHSASQDFPTLGEPARMCRPCEISASTIKFNGWNDWLIKVSPSIVLRFVIRSLSFGMQGATGIEKALSYLESLLNFLELNPEDWEPLIQQAALDLDQSFSTGAAVHADRMMQILGELTKSVEGRKPFLPSNFAVTQRLAVGPNDFPVPVSGVF